MNLMEFPTDNGLWYRYFSFLFFSFLLLVLLIISWWLTGFSPLIIFFFWRGEEGAQLNKQRILPVSQLSNEVPVP
ncbi:hypothetical protein BDV28DRAFT_127111, partial [Aspergillus coremiiformis]